MKKYDITRRLFLAAVGGSLVAPRLGHAQDASPNAAPGTSRIKPGVWPVMFTPFTESREVDYNSIKELTEFYVTAKVSGVFAAALSGEFFDLSPEEAIEIGRCVFRHASGRMGVVVGANYGTTLEEQAASLARMQDIGVDAAVVVLSKLPSRDDIEGQLIRLTELTKGPLGVYECPWPERRQISVESTRRLAQTGRFHFFKETSRDAEVCGAKAQATKGTPFRVFSATLSITSKVLDLGADGHCGTVANYCPELMNRLCETHEPAKREQIQHSLEAFNDVVGAFAYPSSGKYVLGKRGLHLGVTSRSVPATELTAGVRATLDEFLTHFDFQCGLTSG